MFLILGIVLPFLESANLSQFANESTIWQVIFSSEREAQEESPKFLGGVERGIVRLCELHSDL